MARDFSGGDLRLKGSYDLQPDAIKPLICPKFDASWYPGASSGTGCCLKKSPANVRNAFGLKSGIAKAVRDILFFEGLGFLCVMCPTCDLNLLM